MSIKTFHLRPGAPSDVEAMCGAFLDAFSGNTVGRTFFPRSSPSARQFWMDALTEEIHDPNARFIIVVQEEEKDPSDSVSPAAVVVGFAKWNTPAPATTAPLTDNWPEDGDPVRARVFFRKLADMHGEIMGPRPHWYLEIIVVKREFQARGAGGMMMQWGVDQADAERVECYLDATPEGKPLYEKFGFRDKLVWPFFDDVYEHSFMVREPRDGKTDASHPPSQ